MKKLMMTLSIIAILALPGCCCKRSDAPKAKASTHKVTRHKKQDAKKDHANKKHVVKKHKAAPKKKHSKKHAAVQSHDANHPKHVHIELDDTERLFS